MRLNLFLLFAAFASVCALAQSPVPVIVPADSQVATTKSAPAISDSSSGQNLLKMLQEMKAANEETLRRQATELDQLDELQKVADEIRLYTRRS